MLFGNFNHYIDEIKEEYQHQVDRANYAYQQMQEWNKDKEIQSYQQQLKDLRSHCLLIMSDKEAKAEKEFRDKHWRECAEPLKSKAKGNTYIYELSGTGLGTVIKITCPICGKTEDITDIDSW